MDELIITNNAAEFNKILYDDIRFAILHRNNKSGDSRVILLNPQEAVSMARFILSLGLPICSKEMGG